MRSSLLILTSFILHSSFFIHNSFAAAPKIGATVALRSGYGPQQYLSNAFFKERPVVATMAKAGLDVCWYDGWGKPVAAGPVAAKPLAGGTGSAGVIASGAEGENAGKRALESLKQFNAIWLITDHEDECPYSAAEVGEALKAYVLAGGGLVVSFSAGRYPEAPVDRFWTEALKVFDMEILHEEIADFSTRRKDGKVHQQELFHVAPENFAKHPLAEGVRGLWLPMRGGFPSHPWAVPAVKYSADWQVVVRTSAKGASYLKNRRTNFVEWNDSNRGFYREGAPIVAVRNFGKGRVVFEAIHKDNSGWMYGIDKWPNWVEEGELHGKPSDTLRLLENALRWAAEPSLGDAGFTKNYRPVEPKEPPYKKIDAGRTPDEKMKWIGKPLAAEPIAAGPLGTGSIAAEPLGGNVKGLVGLHSNYSDGESTVAEYAAEAKRLGVDFIVFADDLALLSEAKLMALRRDCAAVSDGKFYACPGVEFVDMDGLQWLLCHDKIEFPKTDFLRDGRIYKVMENGVVRQRNFYGHQNLYRGAVLNTEAFARLGIDQEQFADFNGIVPKVYDVDRLEYDNVEVNKRYSANLHLVYPFSFTRVKRAGDLVRAMAASVTFGDTIEGVKATVNNKGAYGNVYSGRNHGWVRCGGDVAIEAFAFARIPGTDTYLCRVAASSSAGLGELLVDDDGGRRVIARFDAKGAKEFTKEFTLLMDRQMAPCFTVTDLAGNTAHATPTRLHYQHAGLNRCSDNSNLLSCNPGVMFSNNWDDKTMPCYKQLIEGPKHWHFSEAFPWEGMSKNPSKLPRAAISSENGRIPLKGIAYPSEEEGVMPSARLELPLIAPNSVAILEQTFGEKVMTPTRGPDRATYAFGPVQVKVADGRYWRRRHRVYQFSDRADTWWRAVWLRNVGDYRGGYSVCEGEIEFTEEVELAAPVELCRSEAENPSGKIEVFRRGEKLGQGGYYATVASEKAWYAWFGFEGGDPLAVEEKREGNRVVSRLTVGERRKYRKGEKIAYRFACGSFNEPPREGLYLEWIARMLNGEGFHHAAKKGKILGVDGLLEVEAEANEAVVELGPEWFIQDYPVRVAGLVDNGSAVALDEEGRVFRPLGFETKAGPLAAGPLGNGSGEGNKTIKQSKATMAYVELPLEKRRTWRLMNLYVTDDPALRFSVVPAMPGHERETVEIHNPTTRDVKAMVRDVRAGRVFDVEIAAGSTAVR